MSRKIAEHNSRIRMLLFFARPLHIFNIVLFVKMWKLLSYGPSTFDNAAVALRKRHNCFGAKNSRLTFGIF